MKYSTLSSIVFSACCILSSSCDNLSTDGKLKTDPINPNLGGEPVVNKEDAYKWAKRHTNNNFIVNQAKEKGGRSYYFTNRFLDIMKNQKDCVGLNFYLANAKDDEMTLLVVSVNSEGVDLTGTYKNDKNIDEQYIIGQTTMKCPDNCDVSSFLYKGK
ncbi:hypothetical protein [Hymenobacter yonginensis]|uniref:Lipoprotein n=1 Tax=Hymenobacter yonginensis TaxID=748197 RepID=A0ABY7PM95_9BACT|nr:hypothetical protein [Hymenobacter yonginensis]WBO84087.1 hypothetical protein O9Z63_17125 [Hymenobacter yonginensis]